MAVAMTVVGAVKSRIELLSSLIAGMKTRIHPPRSPALIIGTVMSRNTRTREAPSTLAACSSSGYTLWTAAWQLMKAKGRNLVRYASMRIQSVP